MSAVVAVASGKGGTGKTTVAVNLAAVAGPGGVSLTLLDCDVEEPNVALFLRPRWARQQRVCVPQPTFDRVRCDGCGRCREACRFNAIVVLPDGPVAFPELCHSCGACVRACPAGAIAEEAREIGVQRTGRWRSVTVADGVLDVGQPRSAPLIDAVRAQAGRADLVIIDAPPGTSCPVVAAVRRADYLLLVAEPTPFGVHDLRLTLRMAEQLGVRTGVVVNRAGIGDAAVYDLCRAEGIDILAEIPFDRRLAECCSTGGLIVEAFPEYRQTFSALLDRVRSEVAA